MTLDEILRNHEHIIKQILPKVSPMKYFQDYLHHGFYPFFLENRNFTENLLKTMNMMTEVDILLIKQIELKYLTKIKTALLSAGCRRCQGSQREPACRKINTSRATVMNYIKYLADARLINMIYPDGSGFSEETIQGDDAQLQPDVRHLSYTDRQAGGDGNILRQLALERPQGSPGRQGPLLTL